MASRPYRLTGKLATLLVALALILSWFPATNARGGGLAPSTTTLNYPSPPVLATAAAMLDVNSGQWLYQALPDQPLPMASTTKIMTALLALKYGKLSDLVTISKAAASIGGTSMGLKAGERVTLRELLYGLLLPSGNDAGVAIAEHIAGSMSAFAAMMNVEAASLKLANTHYLNSYGFFDTPDGDNPQHYSSARDLVLLAREAMNNSLFRTIVATTHIVLPAADHHPKYTLQSVNYVTSWYPGADGVKPGWTSGAGICQVVDWRSGGRHLLVALLHTPNLYTDIRDLLNFGSGDFTWHPSLWPAVDLIDQHVATGTGSSASWYFPYTGHAVGGAFLNYFKAHGGVTVLGFPRTESLTGLGEVQQFFTNQALAQDPVTGTVHALPLGLQAVPRQSLLLSILPASSTNARTYFPQTGHSVTYRFRDFFLANGGVGTFGYPITEKIYEGQTLVQYFENAKLVWHATTASSGYVYAAPLGDYRLAALRLLPDPTPARDGSSTAGPIASPAVPTATAGSAGDGGNNAPPGTPTPGSR